MLKRVILPSWLRWYCIGPARQCTSRTRCSGGTACGLLLRVSYPHVKVHYVKSTENLLSGIPYAVMTSPPWKRTVKEAAAPQSKVGHRVSTSTIQRRCTSWIYLKTLWWLVYGQPSRAFIELCIRLALLILTFATCLLIFTCMSCEGKK